jgi:hypothetical protein
MNRHNVAAWALIATSMLVGCENDVTPLSSEDSVDNWIDIRLSGTLEGSSALLFQVVGGPVDSVSSDRHTVFYTEQTSNELQVLLVGELTNDIVARVWVPDPSLTQQYSAVLEQSATIEGFRQQSVTGYSLDLETAVNR